MVNRVPLCLVWPSRHFLRRKMTKEKFKEDMKYFFSFVRISNTTVTSSKQNFVSWKIFIIKIAHEKIKVT